jgi:pimeloyl-ACP methyl ester carboxylesterase
MAGYLAAIADLLGLDRLHVVGVSYGGFIAEEFARLYQHRLHTLTLSGILLSHETLFQMYEAMSLRFYRGGPAAFELYTHYMYEKIFGEEFVTAMGPERLEAMRQRFHDRYATRVFSLIRLTEAQDPFFAALDEHLPQYRAIRTPTLVMPGADDRAIPLWMQRKICGVLPDARWEPIERSGHVVYLERPDAFWPRLRAFMAAKSTAFELPRN